MTRQPINRQCPSFIRRQKAGTIGPGRGGVERGDERRRREREASQAVLDAACSLAGQRATSEKSPAACGTGPLLAGLLGWGLASAAA